MNWTDLNGSELLKRVFTHPVPIEEVSIFSIIINRDGPNICIDFDLKNKIPDAPIKSWTQSKFNRCRIGINCGGVEELLITGWGTANNAIAIIEKVSPEKTRVRFFNKKLQISFLCTDLTVTGPSVYLDSFVAQID